MNDQTPPAIAPGSADYSAPLVAPPPDDQPFTSPLHQDSPGAYGEPWPEPGPDMPPLTSEQAGELEAITAPPPPVPRNGPQLMHSGTYALWQTPAGNYHLTYRRTAGTHPDTGAITAIDNAPDVHLRDLPPHAADMVIAVLDRDTELPPMLQQFFFGTNPLAGGKLAAMKQVMTLMKEGGLDQLMDLAGQGSQNGDTQ